MIQVMSQHVSDTISRKIIASLKAMVDRGDWTEKIGSRNWSFYVRGNSIEAEAYDARRHKIVKVVFKLSLEKVVECED